MTPTAKSPTLAKSAAAGPAPARRACRSATALDAAIAELGLGARAWSHLTLGQRARLLERLHATDAAERRGVGRHRRARRRASSPDIRCAARSGSAGPTATLVALDAYRASLRGLAKGASPLKGVKTDAAPGGRVRAHVFPLAAIDGLLLSGFTGEVWFEPGVTDAAGARVCRASAS